MYLYFHACLPPIKPFFHRHLLIQQVAQARLCDAVLAASIANTVFARLEMDSLARLAEYQSLCIKPRSNPLHLPLGLRIDTLLITLCIDLGMAPSHGGNIYLPFVDLIRLETVDERTYRSVATPFAPGGPVGSGRAYGGHVFAQAAWAACQTVGDGYLLHVSTAVDGIQSTYSSLSNG
jgi:hypothetical protein